MPPSHSLGLEEGHPLVICWSVFARWSRRLVEANETENGREYRDDKHVLLLIVVDEAATGCSGPRIPVSWLRCWTFSVPSTE